MSKKIIQINENDNVAIAINEIPAGTEILDGIISHQTIPQGHKIALSDIPKDG